MIKPIIEGGYKLFDNRKGYYFTKDNVFKYFSFDNKLLYSYKIEGKIVNTAYVNNDILFYYTEIVKDEELKFDTYIVNFKKGEELIKLENYDCVKKNSGVLLGNILDRKLELMDVNTLKILWSIDYRSLILEDTSGSSFYSFDRKKGAWVIRKFDLKTGEEIWKSLPADEIEKSSEDMKGISDEMPSGTGWFIIDKNTILVTFLRGNILFMNSNTGEAIKYFNLGLDNSNFYIYRKKNVALKLWELQFTYIDLDTFELTTEEIKIDSIKYTSISYIYYISNYVFFLHYNSRQIYFIDLDTLKPYLFSDYFEIKKDKTVRSLYIDNETEIFVLSYLDQYVDIFDLKDLYSKLNNTVQ